MAPLDKEDLIIDFLRRELHAHREALLDNPRPLMVGLQGPQGSGKSYTCARVAERLAQDAQPLRMAVFSLDDLYLPHAELQALAEAHPQYALLQGRGQPGTHDVVLGTRILQSLRRNERVSVPLYDKSAHDGEGDRAPMLRALPYPLDIVLFEGWCLGFQSRTRHELAETVTKADPGAAYAQCSVDELAWISQQLHRWETDWYPLLDAFVQFLPNAEDGSSPWSLIYPWRLEAEHAMKMLNGGHAVPAELRTIQP
ncbi:glycerate 3-kinase [Malassezia nana]|uniref:Glycerate 3-kinase n=1 Tax=Malassezia nana TaxID=180528 RepID=A0AAF0J151_9BASI|nr:glycerate 3-kinase [Malassezia nana]